MFPKPTFHFRTILALTLVLTGAAFGAFKYGPVASAASLFGPVMNTINETIFHNAQADAGVSNPRGGTEAPFTPGNIVVCRAGDGINSLSAAAAPVFLDEYTPGG